jgi:hypothetical protein
MHNVKKQTIIIPVMKWHTNKPNVTYLNSTLALPFFLKMIFLDENHFNYGMKRRHSDDADVDFGAV